jgi:alpha-ribazole phosphatase
MELYLIRHTTPNVLKNTIYGWADVECLPKNFVQEAISIQAKIPSTINIVFSSDSLRCKQLAQYLFPNQQINYTSKLRELNFGDWEMKTWNSVNQTHLQKWMNNFVHEVVPNGESYRQLYERVEAFIISLQKQKLQNPIVIICHAGVIRSLLCYFNKTSLQNSFNTYKVPLGAVYKVVVAETVSTELL